MMVYGKVAIVTGGAAGIGRAIALRLASEGADIVVADIDMQAANQVVDGVRTLGRKALALNVDVTKSRDTREMARTAIDAFGKIDILINNAGGSARGKRSLFHESDEEIWNYVLSINLGGVLNSTRSVINHMIERGSGKIVSIASDAGIIGRPGLTDYSAAKAGIIGFSRALAKEVASHGINVNCVSPGPTETQAMSTVAHIVEELKRGTGFGRLARPEEIAAVVVFLASDEASFITGQNYPVCGLRNLGA